MTPQNERDAELARRAAREARVIAENLRRIEQALPLEANTVGQSGPAAKDTSHETAPAPKVRRQVDVKHDASG